MAGQNTSSAVMQQRAHRAPGELDYFPTPPWATRALCEFLQGAEWGRRLGGWDLSRYTVWEPACGELHMARPLAEYFSAARATDVFDYGQGSPHDFLLDPFLPGIDWLVTNPPFKLSLAFVAQGLLAAKYGVAMLVRTSWLEGAQRYTDLFAKRPPSFVLQFSQRVVMLEGRLVQEGAPDPFNVDPATGLPRKASTATSYAWVIWEKCADRWQDDTRHRWVPPIRKELERPGDYPDHSAALAAITAATESAARGGLLLNEGN